MGQILRNWRVLVALIFSIALVVGSYVLVRGVGAPPLAVASTESELLKAIAERDSDGDSLTDWEEALYGTDPHKTDTRGLGMTDGEAVAKGLVVPKAIDDIQIPASSDISYDEEGLPSPPAEGTLTDAFVKSFMTLYAAARSANGDTDLSTEQLQDIAAQSIAALSTLVVGAPDYKTAKDLKVSGSGESALTAFAADAEAVLKKHRNNAEKSEVEYLKAAVEQEDRSGFPYIESIAKSYRVGAVGLAALTVPVELEKDHLALVNAMMRLSEISSDFVRLYDDPLATIIALEQYPVVLQKMLSALKGIHTVYESQGIIIPPSTEGFAFLHLAEVASTRSDILQP
jgi:hypothetical protein